MTPDTRRLAQALALYQQARDARARNDIAAAADAFRRALALAPDHPGILADYGQLAEDVQDWKAAEQLYRRLMAIRNLLNLDGKLGVALYHLGRYAEAIPLLEAFAARNPQNGPVLRFLGTCHFRLFHFDDARRCGELAYAAQPHPDALALQLAVEVELGEREPTAHLTERALRDHPGDWQLRKLAGEHLLKDGDYARGFPLFRDMRVPADGQRHYVEHLELPAWDGAPFNGTLLVGGEQGVGDEILTASLYAEIARLGQAAVIETDARLLPLFRRSFPSLEFVDRAAGALREIAAARPDCRKIISGDLGALFRRRPADFPATAAGWLVPDATRAAEFRAQYEARWPGRRRVGLSWRSQRVMRSGARKDIDLAALAPLFGVRPDAPAAFVNLQYGDVGPDLATLGAGDSCLYVDPQVDTFNDIDTLFAQVAALDLVITTSNVTAHVAGAQGKPCWVLLPHRRPVIWYWGYAGDTTPWYPRSRLYRCTGEGRWPELVDRLAADLAAFLAQGREIPD